MTPGQFRTARRAKDMTQAKVAAYLGTARNTVSRYERGERAIPPLVAIRMAGPSDELVEAAAKAMRNAVIRDDEGEFPRLFDLLDFSGENKAHTVTNGLARAAITAVLDYVAKLDTGELPAARPPEARARVARPVPD